VFVFVPVLSRLFSKTQFQEESIVAERYREIEVAGSCHMMGQQIGEAAREEIHGFVATALERISQTIHVSRATIRQVSQQSTVFLKDYAPDLVQEIQGMSEGSTVPFDDLMFLQIRNQLTANMDSGCTSFSVAAAFTESRQPLIGQNWDNDPALNPFTVVLTRRPADKPAWMSITQAGLIAYIGFSEAGMAACLNSLPAPARAVGVPHYFTLRRLFEASSLEAGVAAIAFAWRAVPASIMLATPQGPANLEVTLENVHVVRPTDGQVLTHTNHCLHPELRCINSQFDELIQSKPRLKRVDWLLAEAGLLNIEALKNVLRDHDGFPMSLCRHANGDVQHGYWETVFSVVMSPETGAMHVSRGNPCTQDYEIYSLR